MNARYDRAAKAFEDFTGRRPKSVKTTRLPDRDVTGWGMGPVVGIAYEAVRDGRKQRYFHEFAKSARPDLVAREDGKQLYLAGGKYTVTDRGIEDMPELFVVNPSRRSGASTKRKPAMAAAKRRNSKGRFTKRAAASAPRRKRRAATQIAMFKSNPAPKRRGKRRSAPRLKRRTFRRNPSGGALSLGKMIVPAAGIGAGAVGSEILMGYLPIPANLKSGVLRHVTKGAVGLIAGWGIAKFLRQKRLGTYFQLGAVAIAVHDMLKEFIAGHLTGIPSGGFGQYVAPLPSQFGGMGYISPAATTRFGQYVAPLPSQFAGASQAYEPPGGETMFQA